MALSLRISERTWGERLWPAHLVSDDPRTADDIVASVGSYDEARSRAGDRQQALQFTREAWMQMVDEGVAPRTFPDDVTIVAN